jgi:4-diphosphocytidyl-2C-methyl-D-erythritol 2-phosphate synthase
VRIPSFAKVNLGLEILGKRPDGYHDIRTLFQWVDFFDLLELRPLDGPEIRLRGDDPSIPWDESNLVFKAAVLLREAGGSRRGAEIVVAKRVPAGGGFGGGSSNAAAVLLGLNRLWELGLEPADLEALGRKLGMDVPYFFHRRSMPGGGAGRPADPPARSAGPLARSRSSSLDRVDAPDLRVLASSLLDFRR